MKNNISVIAVIVALSSGLYVNTSRAENTKFSNCKGTCTIKEKAKKLFTKEYDHNDLLNILADIETDLRSGNITSIKGKSDEILNYLNYHKNEVKKSGADVLRKSDYKGDKVLELEYGNWFESKELILPLELENKPLNYNFLHDRIVLSGFTNNQINNAKIRYISYDIENKGGERDLYKLLSSIEEGNINQIRKNVIKVYDDILIDHSDKISLVARIRDNLIVAKYLNDNNQFKAAENSISFTDSLILRLIEATSNSPEQQAKVKNLRKELKNTQKLSDENYISEWEKIPDEVGNWWKNN
jgi:hypothetical protein